MKKPTYKEIEIIKKCIELFNNLSYLRELNKEDYTLKGIVYNENIQKIFDYFSNSGIPKYKQNLLFDLSEKFYEEDYMTLAVFKHEIIYILRDSI